VLPPRYGSSSYLFTAVDLLKAGAQHAITAVATAELYVDAILTLGKDINVMHHTGRETLGLRTCLVRLFIEIDNYVEFDVL